MRLSHTQMTVYQLKQVIKVYEQHLKKWAPEKGRPYPAESKKKHTYIASRLRNAEFVLQRKQDGLNKDTKKDVERLRKSFKLSIAVWLEEPYDETGFNFWVKNARQFIQNYNQ